MKGAVEVVGAVEADEADADWLCRHFQIANTPTPAAAQPQPGKGPILRVRMLSATAYACLEVPHVGQLMYERGQAVAITVAHGGCAWAGMATLPGLTAGTGRGLSE